MQGHCLGIHPSGRRKRRSCCEADDFQLSCDHNQKKETISFWDDRAWGPGLPTPFENIESGHGHRLSKRGQAAASEPAQYKGPWRPCHKGRTAYYSPQASSKRKPGSRFFAGSEPSFGGLSPEDCDRPSGPDGEKGKAGCRDEGGGILSHPHDRWGDCCGHAGKYPWHFTGKHKASPDPGIWRGHWGFDREAVREFREGSVFREAVRQIYGCAFPPW